jgi:hypothetical protein
MSEIVAHPETTAKTDELIEFLCLRMYPDMLTMAAQSEIVSGARRDEALAYLQSAEEYAEELRALNPEALQALIEDEHDKDRQAELEEAAKLEDERFFNKPTARAYYRSWVERNHWTLDEATALILGKDPKVVNWDSIDPLVHKSAFARRYESLRRQFLRARFDGMLFEPLVPADFLRYAKSIGFALPIELDRLLQSDDEERMRSQQRALDEIQLAKLRKAIEEAAAPPQFEPEAEAEPEPQAEADAEEDTVAEAADESLDQADLNIDEAESEPAADAVSEAPDIESEVSDIEIEALEDEAEAEELEADAADIEAEADASVSDATDNIDIEEAAAAAEPAEADRAFEDTAFEDGASEDGMDEVGEPNGHAATDAGFAMPAALQPAKPASIADIAEELIRHTKSLTSNGLLNGTKPHGGGADEADEAHAEEAEAEDAVADAGIEAMPGGERETLLKIFVAMAIGRYGYEPDSKRNSTVTDIVRDHEKIGLTVSPSTVRKWLREASKLVPEADS